MRICPRCGANYPDGSFCPQDGTPLADRTDRLLGETLLGQFQIVGELGRGAMGTVYQAWQPCMERPVAVKVLHRSMARDPNLVRRFLREARAAAGLAHPSIVTVYVAGETADGRPYLVMEYLEGETLAEAMSGRRRLPPARAIAIARQIADALADAHAEGIVHRDLKPDNVILQNRRRAADVVKVLDFGIAKILDREKIHPGESNLTRDGAIFGTPHYIAPEQAAGARVDHRADLYSVGVLLYRMLAGRLPFEGANLPVLIAHMSREAPAVSEHAPDLDPDLAALVMRCLEKDPARRFQSAEELAAALDEAADAASRPAAPVETPASRPAAPPRLRPRRLALLLGLLVAVGLSAAAHRGAARPSADPPHALVRAEELPPPPGAAAGSGLAVRAALVSQEGLSLRALLPERLVAGMDHEITIDAWGRDGEPLEAAGLAVVLLEPGGIERGTIAPATELPGRYRFHGRFEAAGSYTMRVVPPAGGLTFQIHFEVDAPQA